MGAVVCVLWCAGAGLCFGWVKAHSFKFQGFFACVSLPRLPSNPLNRLIKRSAVLTWVRDAAAARRASCLALRASMMVDASPVVVVVG